MLEEVLIRAFFAIYDRDFECDDDKHAWQPGRSRRSARRAWTLLSSVCWAWYYTLNGWPGSQTGLWVKQQRTKLLRRECTTLVVYLTQVYMYM